MTNISEKNPASDWLRREIVRDCISFKKDGARIISPKGAAQNWMIDLRPIFLRRDTLELIAGEFWCRHAGMGPFQIGAMETAGVPLLTALLLTAPEGRRDVNTFIVRKERKTTGLGRTLEGKVTDQPVIFVDDIVNSAASAEKARTLIEAEGLKIAHMFAMIDYRSRRGLDWRRDHNIEIDSLFTLDDFDLKLHQDPPPCAQRYREVWRRAIPGGNPFHVVPKSTPLLVGSRIYRGCDSGKMHAFDADTGSTVWEFQTTGSYPLKGVWSSPAYHDGRLYFGAYNGVLYCLDAGNGAEIWTQSEGEWVGASPLIAPEHGLVFFGIEYERPWAQGGIAALDLNTGAKVWEHPIAKFQHGSPAYWRSGDLLIWGTADHFMAGIDPKSGEAAWVFQTRRSVKASPAVHEDRGLVAFASFDKSIYVLDAATGEKRGEWETGEICYTTPLFTGDRLFCGSGDRHMYVIDLDSMSLIKAIDMKARVYSSPRLVGDRVIFGTNGGRVMELDQHTLEIKSLVQFPDAVTNPVVVSPDGRRIFVSTYMNHLFACERL